MEKRTRINLHIRKNKVVLIAISIGVLLLLLNFVVCLSIENDIAQLYSLWQSDYEYSAKMIPVLTSDNYYLFDAGITFKPTEDTGIGINADVVMQSAGAQYTESVFWNTETLGVSEIAISSNVARQYELHVGDSLFSKHIVNDKICEYKIISILPEASNIRVNEDSHSKGIIIMGYDDRYVDNIAFINIVYSNKPVNELFSESNNSLTDIVYRHDEIKLIWIRLLPYIVAYGLFAVILSLGLLFCLKKEVSHNFKRLVILGFAKRELNVAYNDFTIGIGVLTSLLVLSLSVLIALWLKYSVLLIAYFLFVFLIEVIIIVAFSYMFREKLWRS